MNSPWMGTRRQFLARLATRLAAAGTFAATGSGVYALWDAKRPRVTRVETPLRHLPTSFDGLTVAFLTDTHHGPFVPVSYLEHVVALTNALRPDLLLLGGDYVERSRGPRRRRGRRRTYIEPGIAALGGLRAPLGRYAVLGNHDYLVDPELTRRTLDEHGFIDLTNRGVWLERGADRLRLAGVDDKRKGRPRLRTALGDMTGLDACLLFTHNPDYVERVRDRRVDLVLCGHTHGGQVYLPGYGAPVTSSHYGQKYRAGLVQGPRARVYVSRGIGTIGPPVRVCCPPEIVLLVLRASPDAPTRITEVSA